MVWFTMPSILRNVTFTVHAVGKVLKSYLVTVTDHNYSMVSLDSSCSSGLEKDHPDLADNFVSKLVVKTI